MNPEWETLGNERSSLGKTLQTPTFQGKSWSSRFGTFPKKNGRPKSPTLAENLPLTAFSMHYAVEGNHPQVNDRPNFSIPQSALKERPFSTFLVMSHNDPIRSLVQQMLSHLGSEVETTWAVEEVLRH